MFSRNRRHPAVENALLFTAIEEGNQGKVALALQQGADPNAKRPKTYSHKKRPGKVLPNGALATAVHLGNLSVTKDLLLAGADPNTSVPIVYQRTVFSDLIYVNSLASLAAILSGPFSMCQAFPLDIAIWIGKPLIVEALLDSKAFLRVESKLSVLNLAILVGNGSVLRLVVRAIMQQNSCLSLNKSSLTTCMLFWGDPMISFFLQHAPSIAWPKNAEPLLHAVTALEQQQCIQMVLDVGVNLDSRFESMGECMGSLVHVKKLQKNQHLISLAASGGTPTLTTLLQYAYVVFVLGFILFDQSLCRFFRPTLLPYRTSMKLVKTILLLFLRLRKLGFPFPCSVVAMILSCDGSVALGVFSALLGPIIASHNTAFFGQAFRTCDGKVTETIL